MQRVEWKNPVCCLFLQWYRNHPSLRLQEPQMIVPIIWFDSCRNMQRKPKFSAPLQAALLYILRADRRYEVSIHPFPLRQNFVATQLCQTLRKTPMGIQHIFEKPCHLWHGDRPGHLLTTPSCLWVRCHVSLQTHFFIQCDICFGKRTERWPLTCRVAAVSGSAREWLCGTGGRLHPRQPLAATASICVMEKHFVMNGTKPWGRENDWGHAECWWQCSIESFVFGNPWRI